VSGHLKLMDAVTAPDSEAPVRVDDNVSFLAPKKAGTP
jgi:hypothetical protein